MKASKSARQIAPVTLSSSLEQAGCARVGWITGVSNEGEPLVDYPGNLAGPLPAVLAVDATRRNLAAAAERRQAVVIQFDAGDPGRPILLAFVFPPPPSEERPVAVEVAAPKLPEVAEVDGRRVRIEGKDEIILHCGEASITLDRQGRVTIRGAQVVSQATGVNQVQGGSVRLN
jgi:hypothetical protein